jgi:hypothetical protein
MPDGIMFQQIFKSINIEFFAEEFAPAVQKFP